MPAQVARIFVSILLLALGALFYPTLLVIQGAAFRYSFIPYEARFWIAGFLCWFFVKLAWFLAWRDQVVRSKQRRLHSVAVTLATLGIGPLLWISLLKVWDVDSEFATILSSCIAPLLGLIGTVIVYTDTPNDRAMRALALKAATVRCPACRYNLAGLTSTRCPECGKEYTLDALLAAQAQPAGQDV